MGAREKWESASLEWIHRVREEHYRKTKDAPLGEWLRPVESAKAGEACRRLGLRVRARRGEKKTSRERA